MSYDWNYIPLKELLLIKPRNGLYKDKSFQGRGNRWIKMKEIYGNDFFLDQDTEFLDVSDEEIEKFGCVPGDLLFGRTSLILEGIGDCLLVGDVLDVPIFESNLFRIRFDSEKADPRFYYYLFKSSAGKALIQTIAKQTAATSITSTDLIKLDVPHPPLDIQSSIAQNINVFDKKININRHINQTLEAMAQAIFKSWFVDFEPVKAKIAAIEAGENAEDVTRAAMSVISGKTDEELDQLQAEQPDNYTQLKTTAELFPSTMQDSELGEVPDGWEISTIGDEVGVVGGGTPSTKNQEFWEDGEIHWTTPKDLSNLSDKILLTTDRKITVAGLKNISSGLLPINTVLMSSRAPVGYLALAKIPVAINQGYIAMICDKRLSPEFVIQWCNSVMDTIKQRSSGTTFAEISKKNFKVIPVIVPSEEIQQSYSKLVSGFYDKIAEAAMECKTLSDIRDSLLPKLLSGEIIP